MADTNERLTRQNEATTRELVGKNTALQREAELQRSSDRKDRQTELRKLGREITRLRRVQDEALARPGRAAHQYLFYESLKSRRIHPALQPQASITWRGQREMAPGDWPPTVQATLVAQAAAAMLRTDGAPDAAAKDHTAQSVAAEAQAASTDTATTKARGVKALLVAYPRYPPCDVARF